ncbi:MAG: hydantoinase/oxoprolinase family protein, partial [Synergistaceae bacterium]|nr:hydantoinase/oxoprolinase family protein [Synergistaceae bacterium]
MRLGLGIDTGGTYTDGVLFDYDTNKIITSQKTLTYKENLLRSILELLDAFPEEMLKEIKFVALSTTLATNACVEGKGCQTALTLIGCDPDIMANLGPEYGIESDTIMIFLDGGYSQKGQLIKEPDWDALTNWLDNQAAGVDAFAVVELWGFRNPRVEKTAKEIIYSKTLKPVVCAHELTSEINSLKRVASTIINASLIPLVNRFMDSVKVGLTERAVSAPIAVVRGDGSLMSEEFARKKPVETLLSGPAASISGGVSLSRISCGIVVDMGGTTCDIAFAEDSLAGIAHDGVVIGKWKTGTKSVMTHTIGLGGDSRLTFDADFNLTIGPERVAPISWLISKHPEKMSELANICKYRKAYTKNLCEFLFLVEDVCIAATLGDDDAAVVKALSDGPLSISELSDRTKISLYSLNTTKLERYGIIQRCGVTPTDIAHITGELSKWDAGAAELCTEYLAFKLKMTIRELASTVKEQICRKIFSNILILLTNTENEKTFRHNIESNQASNPERLSQERLSPERLSPERLSPERLSPEQLPDTDRLAASFDFAYTSHKSLITNHIKCLYRTDVPLIGIGAPVHMFLPEVAKALDTVCHIPAYAPVANAVGAITGNVNSERSVLIRPNYLASDHGAYTCYSGDMIEHFIKYDDALEWSKSEAVRLAVAEAKEKGAKNINTIVDVFNNSVELTGYYADSGVLAAERVDDRWIVHERGRGAASRSEAGGGVA